MVTAELAVAIMALAVAMVAVLSGIQWASYQSRAQEVARAASRQLARGDDPARVAAHVAASLPGAAMSRSASGEFATVTIVMPARLMIGIPVTVQADAHVLLEQP